MNQGRRSSGGRDWTSSWGTIRLTVVLESFALLHGMATVIEELGVVLLLATHGKVACVVGIIRLRRVLGYIKNNRLAGGVTSRISAIQPGGGVARATMGRPLTAERAARATRARETNLNMTIIRGR